MIIVSLTTIPPRFHNSLICILDLYVNQTIKPDLIIFNICKNYNRFENIEFDFSNQEIQKLIKNNKLIINLCDDYGALTKLYPTINYINEHINTIDNNIAIITIDDDCLYINNLIEILYNEFLIDNNKAYGFFGFLLNNNQVGEQYKPTSTKMELDVIGGVNGCIYNYSFFNNIKYHNYVKNLSFDEYLCDDEVTCLYLKYLNIKKIALINHTFKSIDNMAYESYALHKNNVRKRQNNTIKKCMNILYNL